MFSSSSLGQSDEATAHGRASKHTNEIGPTDYETQIEQPDLEGQSPDITPYASEKAKAKLRRENNLALKSGLTVNQGQNHLVESMHESPAKHLTSLKEYRQSQFDLTDQKRPKLRNLHSSLEHYQDGNH